MLQKLVIKPGDELEDFLEDSGKKLSEFKGQIERLVKVYKIHVNPKNEEINSIMAVLLHDDELNQFTKTWKIKNFLDGVDDNKMPILAFYAQGKDNAQQLLNHLCEKLSSFKGRGIIPRYNKKVNDLIFFAQGNGDDKNGLINQAKTVFKNEEDKRKKLLEIFYDTDADYVYYSEKFNEIGDNKNYTLDISSCKK